MIHDDALIERIEQFNPGPWSGIVFRHCWQNYPPDRVNIRGARWNLPDVQAIYTCIERSVCLAEIEYQISLQPLKPSAKRTLYRLQVSLNEVLDLGSWTKFEILGLKPPGDLTKFPLDRCQEIGGAVEWLGYDGLLVPSAGTNGFNLVIFPERLRPNHEFKIVDSEVLNR